MNNEFKIPPCFCFDVIISSYEVYINQNRLLNYILKNKPCNSMLQGLFLVVQVVNSVLSFFFGELFAIA